MAQDRNEERREAPRTRIPGTRDGERTRTGPRDGSRVRTGPRDTGRRGVDDGAGGVDRGAGMEE